MNLQLIGGELSIYLYRHLVASSFFWQRQRIFVACARVAAQAWQELVGRAARAAMPDGAWLLTGPLAVTIYIFPGGRLHGDVDNRVKHILDAMAGVIYLEDSQVHRVVAQKFETGNLYPFSAPTRTLVEALQAIEPVVYVRITDDPLEE